MENCGLEWCDEFEDVVDEGDACSCFEDVAGVVLLFTNSLLVRRDTVRLGTSGMRIVTNKIYKS